MPSESFDAIVLGGGPAGEHAVNALLRENLRVALVEGELIGGECSNWACIPTKTLLRPAELLGEARNAFGVGEPSIDWPAVRDHVDYMTSGRDDAARVKGYEERGVTVVKAPGRLAGAGRVEAGGRLLESERILVATGSEAVIPPIEGLEQAGYWTNREATSFRELPESVAILGGGAVGTELAQMFARFGVEASIIQGPDHLDNREDVRVGELICEHLSADGVHVYLGLHADRVASEDGVRVVTCEDGTEVRAQELVVATGRRPRSKDIGLETVGAEVGERGGIVIDERCRAAEGVWAAGDVTAVMLFTHSGKYQARIAVADMMGRPAKADYRAIPRVIFTHPEVAAVGLTEEQAREEGLVVAAVEIDLPGSIARPHTYEKRPAGKLGIVLDSGRGVLVGAWAVAPLASEWIHHAALAIRAEVPLEVLMDTVAQFPSFSEAWLSALQELPQAG